MLLISLIFVLASLCSVVFSGGDPTLLININKASVKLKPNPLMSRWDITFVEKKPLNEVSCDFEFTKDMPDNLMTKFTVSINDKPLPDYKMTACEALENKPIGKGFVDAGNPFPKKCPILKGTYKISNYVVVKDNLPPGIPNGKLTGTIQVYLPDEEPFIVVNFEGDISHDTAIPAIG